MSELYRIRQAERNLAELLTATDGEVTDGVLALEQYLATVDVGDAIEGVLLVADEHRMTGEALRKRAAELVEAARIEEAKAEKLVGYVESYLDDNRIDKLTAGMFKLSFRAKPPSLILPEELDLSTVPEAFVRTKQELNKSDMLKAWKQSGDAILPAGVTVNTTGKSLTGYKIKGEK